MAIEGTPIVYVYYANGTWEQVAWGCGFAVHTRGRRRVAGVGLALCRGLASQGRHLLLGEATQVEPLHSDTVFNPLMAVFFWQRSDGQILLLARSKLRF